jgi:mevalonate kinase
MAKKLSHKIFHSKILLFGEHIINKGAMGLAAPLHRYDGVFKWGNLKEQSVAASNKSLESLANYIVHSEVLSDLYDTNAFLEDVEKGLYFDSNIPQGYGLGSSGALVAAVYYQYRKNRKKNYVVSEVKRELAELESYYHGKSSGLDAIVCYMDKAVLVNNGEVTEAFKLPKSEHAVLKLFLINTHIERKTSPFVNLFLEKCKDKKFMQTVQNSLVPSTNIAIESFLQHKYADLWKSVQIISQLQLDLMPEFIPVQFKQLWMNGLKNQQYCLKVCGAGGGGFIIGIAKADADLHTLLGAVDVEELMQF